MDTEEIIREKLGDCINHIDNNLQILHIKGYWIEEHLVVQHGEGNIPSVQNTITLNGVPHDNNYIVTSAELYFNDDNPKERPWFNHTQKRIYACYPKGDFERILSIINQYPKNLEIMFHDCILTNQTWVKIYCNNPNMII